MKFIAEFCQNHLGDFEILEQMIVQAKKSGATHGKIQGIYVAELTFRSEFENSQSGFFRPFEAEATRLKGLELSFAAEAKFIEICEANGLTPMITVFTHVGADRAEALGFKSIKIASYDCGSMPLIRRCLKFAKEIVISTGATNWNDVSKTAMELYQIKSPEQVVALLHARTLYPCNLNDTKLLRMLALIPFGFPVGFSDHSSAMEDKLLPSKFAIALGAEYLERHFTILDKSKTKDGPVSVSPTQLSTLVEFSRWTVQQKTQFIFENLNSWRSVTRCDSLDPCDVEIDNARYYRGRFASEREGVRVHSWENW